MKFIARFRSPRTFLFYHNFKRLSSTFFEVFQLFKSHLTKLSVTIRFAFAAAFRLYHTRNRLSRTFFKFFQTFSTARNPQPLAQRSLFSLPHRSLFVKYFFRVFSNSQKPFSNSLWSVSCQSPFSQQPWYLSTSKPVCQDPFFNLFRLISDPDSPDPVAFDFVPPSRTASIY